MRRNIVFYVTVKATGQRILLEKQFKWDRWYYSADGWDTQSQTKMGAIEASGRYAITCACTPTSTCGAGDRP